MNSREQILAKRVAALEARLQASMVVIDHLIKDLEFTESVGAAFAFDLAQRTNQTLSDGSPFYGFASNRLLNSLNSDWDGAVKALESAQEELHNDMVVTRNPDGSIEHILPKADR